MRWVDYQYGACIFAQFIIELPGVRRHLQHHIIPLREGLLHPRLQIRELHTTGRQDHIQVFIHA
jgi:hypothetical protein